MQTLLAVDLGLRAGLAVYGEDGTLQWYRSTNFGSKTRLRAGVPGLLRSIPCLTRIVLEGGGELAHIWQKEAERHHIQFRKIHADIWRQTLFYDRERRNGMTAKQNADQMARKVIAWSNAPSPTSLRHDAAEAILIGLWAVIEMGWLAQIPKEIRR